MLERLGYQGNWAGIRQHNPTNTQRQLDSTRRPTDRQHDSLEGKGALPTDEPHQLTLILSRKPRLAGLPQFFVHSHLFMAIAPGITLPPGWHSIFRSFPRGFFMTLVSWYHTASRLAMSATMVSSRVLQPHVDLPHNFSFIFSRCLSFSRAGIGHLPPGLTLTPGWHLSPYDGLVLGLVTQVDLPHYFSLHSSRFHFYRWHAILGVELLSPGITLPPGWHGLT
jgi:hypothetical protein